MGGSRTFTISLVILCCIWLLAACGGGGVSLDEPTTSQLTTQADAGLIEAGRTTSGFTLGILPDTYLGGEPTGDFTVEETREGDETVITVSVSGAEDLRACYASLAYDASRYTPVAVDQLPLVTDDRGEILTLSDTATPGTVDFGQVLANCDVREGLTGDAMLAELKFSDGAFAGSRGVSQVPDTEPEQPYIVIDIKRMQLCWDYYMRGDLNQDGIVGVSDLTPIGLFYGQHTEYGYDFPEGTAQWVADANSDGYVNIYDITVLGQCYGRQVTGYNVFECDTKDAGQPSSVTGPAGSAPVGFIPFDSISGGSGGNQREFDVHAGYMQRDKWYWIRPTNGSAEGIPSNSAFYDRGVWETFGIGYFEQVYGGGHSNENLTIKATDDGQLILDIWCDQFWQLDYPVFWIFYDDETHKAAGWQYDSDGDYQPGLGLQTSEVRDRRMYLHHNDWMTYDPEDTGSTHVARVFFNHEPQAETHPQIPPTTSGVDALAEYDPGTGEYSWYYNNSWDLNQDGVVSSLDLPAAYLFFDERHVDDAGPELTEFVVGEEPSLNLGYLFGISQYWYESVDAYNIYYTTNSFVIDGGLLNKSDWLTRDDIFLLTTVKLSSATGERFKDRLRFSVTLPNTTGRHYWVAPVYQDEVGHYAKGSVIQIPAE